MEDIFRIIVEQFPTFTGLFVLVIVLYRQNERLTDQVFVRLKDMEDRLKQIEILSAAKQAGHHTTWSD